MSKRKPESPVDTTSFRYPVDPIWPAPGEYMLSERISDRNYDVQYYTGYAVSSVPSGSWTRGQIIHQGQVMMRPPTLGYYHYDPTDPTSWHQPQN